MKRNRDRSTFPPEQPPSITTVFIDIIVIKLSQTIKEHDMENYVAEDECDDFHFGKSGYSKTQMDQKYHSPNQREKRENVMLPKMHHNMIVWIVAVFPGPISLAILVRHESMSS